MKHLITFIGFGEASSSVARELCQLGLNNMVAFDAMSDNELRGPSIREKAEKYKVTLTRSAAEACEGARFIITFTSPAVASSVAKDVFPLLKDGQIYIDLNSTSPGEAKQIEAIDRPSGVKFCDGAALGNVSKMGNKVPITLCGDGAMEAKAELGAWGMDISVLDAPIGAASAMKMLRSVVSKGMQQLMLEFTMCARKYGILPEMMQIVNNKFKDITLEEYANEAFIRFIRHAARREAEANNIVETIETVGLDASMSRATAKRFHDLAELKIADQLAPDVNMSYQEVLDLIFKAVEEKNHSKASSEAL